ncbi:phosphate acyltransferase PlsX [Cryptosporangium minutisporangium]|uniref:Phosphate acyltransferase n=1 Tax=Cryptosporangium minutisporangium TaxID=113569 RepID=A0ABP6T435_9ACTN
MATRPVRVALDLLGGDRAPDVVVEGALAALAEDPQLHLVVAGPSGLRPRWASVADRVTLLPTDEGVGMADAPVRAVRNRRTSVRLAVEAVRNGAADAVVSIGPTGAAVAAAVTELGKLPGYRRPVLAAVLPAVAHPVVLLDVGAHAGASDADLVRHGRLGSAFARTALGLDWPRVGLLSVGTEPGKGDSLRKKADRGLTGSGLHYVGLVEGYDIPLGGRADVVVTDGFTGNVVLKTLEGSLALAATNDAATNGAGPNGVCSNSSCPHGAARNFASSASGVLGGGSRRAATLLGVAGTVVIGHGAAGSADVADCVALAAAAVRDNYLLHLRAVLDHSAQASEIAPPPEADPDEQHRSAARQQNRPQARMTAAPAAT